MVSKVSAEESQLLLKIHILSQEQLSSIFNNDKRQWSAGNVYTVVMASTNALITLEAKQAVEYKAETGSAATLMCSSTK